LLSNTTLAERVEKLACEIAGSADDATLLLYARDAAYAEIDLARVRRIKVALIERASAVGTLDRPIFECWWRKKNPRFDRTRSATADRPVGGDAPRR
jgi:hypothetical protein